MTTATAVPATHERFVHGVRDLILSSAQLSGPERDLLAHTKLVYGTGMGGSYRGVTCYGAWRNGRNGGPREVPVVEIAAIAEESWLQLAGTTLHELAHVLAYGHGHDVTWKELCVRLGFTRRPDAAGQVYTWDLFRPGLAWDVARMARVMADGRPSFWAGGTGRTLAPRPCGAGVGTRGGKSRGAGSGSRLRLWECSCEPPVKVRVASDDFQATCKRCGEPFTRPEES